jgi:uncharacterized protein YabE (DUF348 family)
MLPRWLSLGWLVFIVGCRPSHTSSIIILDRGTAYVVQSDSRLTRVLLANAGLRLDAGDHVLANGQEVNADTALESTDNLTLQVLRARTITINGSTLKTVAPTVGQAVSTAGFTLYAADTLEPPADAPVVDGMHIDFRPSAAISITDSTGSTPGRTSAVTVGAALAQAGAPLTALDRSEPAEERPLPPDGQISIHRSTESLLLTQEPIAFKNTFQESAEVELGQEQVVQAGAPGLSISTTRIEYIDGVESTRRSEAAVVVRSPQDRLVSRGTRIVQSTTSIDGVHLQYWRVMQMYATVYSPCNSATGDGRSCSYGTASGLRAGKGVVAVDPALFAYLNGQRLYVPGYGFAVIGDIGGGYIVEQNLGISRYKWIDLGFDDNNLQDLTGWITVYFLAPDALK